MSEQTDNYSDILENGDKNDKEDLINYDENESNDLKYIFCFIIITIFISLFIFLLLLLL
jgi:hypothetical protein